MDNELYSAKHMQSNLLLCQLLRGLKSSTRMHSSRMRTGRSLTVFRSLLFRGGIGTCLVPGATCLVLGGVWSGGYGRYLPGLGGCLVWGVSGPGGYLPGARGVSGPKWYLPGPRGVWSQGGVWSGQELPP